MMEIGVGDRLGIDTGVWSYTCGFCSLVSVAWVLAAWVQQQGMRFAGCTILDLQQVNASCFSTNKIKIKHQLMLALKPML